MGGYNGCLLRVRVCGGAMQRIVLRALVMCMRTEEIGVDENGGGGGSERDGTVARGLGLCEEEAGT